MFNNINKLLSNTILMLVIILLCSFYMFIMIQPLFKVNSNLNRQEEQITYLKSINENLIQTILLVNDEQTRIKMARELYQLSESDDILFVFPEEE